MLPEALAALAAAGGTAVVQAAGTTAWEAFRDRVAAWFGRGDDGRARAELERLDQTAAVLEAAADPGDAERARIRQEASWQARFDMLLEELDTPTREQAAAALRTLLSEHTKAHGGVSAGTGGMVVGGNVDIKAEHGSIAAAVLHGDANITHPSAPDPEQG